MASWQNGVRDQVLIQENSKPQDLIVYTDGSVTKDKSGWGFTVKQDRQCSLYDLSLQLDGGVGSSHPCPLLDFFKRWLSDHTGHHPHGFSELATKSEEWNGKPHT